MKVGALMAAAYAVLITTVRGDGVRLGRKWGRMRLCNNLGILQGSTSTGGNVFMNAYNSLLSWIGLLPGNHELKKSSLWVLEMNKRGGGKKEVSFTDEFERIHGDVHPVVRATSLVEALELARRQNKLLLVYISPRGMCVCGGYFFFFLSAVSKITEYLMPYHMIFCFTTLH